MIKYIYFKNSAEYEQLVNCLLNQNISIWNLHKHKDKNILSFFYNEDRQQININEFEELV